MNTSVSQIATRPSVRMPFRVLAALICFIGTIALLGAFLFVWRGDRDLPFGAIAMIPGMAWFLRLAFHAAASGKVASDVNWPFASAGVRNFYLFVILAYVVSRASW